MKKKFLLGLVAMLLPLTSWAEEKITLTATFAEGIDKENPSVVYAGNDTEANLGITLTVDGKNLSKYTDYNLTYMWTGNGENETAKEVDAIRDAGKYMVSVNFVKVAYKDTYEVTPFQVEVEPCDASIFITAKDNTTPVMLEWGEELSLEQFITINETLLANYGEAAAEKANLLKGLQIVAVGKSEGTEIAEVGNYSVAVDGIKENNPSNYTYTRTLAGLTYALNITKKRLYITLNGKVYNGGEINLNYITTAKAYKLYTDSKKEEKDLATNITNK